MSDTTGAPADLPLPDPELVIEISPPIVYQSGTFDVLRLREPNAREVRNAERNFKGNPLNQGPVEMRSYEIALVQAVSGWPMPAIEALPITKLDEAGRYLQLFIGRGQATGRTS